MEIPHIPVVPIGYGNAGELLQVRSRRRRAARLAGWTCRSTITLAPGPSVRASPSRDDRATKPLKPIYDTFGIVRGSEFPDEMVIIGGHRDGWGPGAADNVSGTVSILEAARAVAEEVKAGVRPKRTIIFATWDAEEWGLIGSTEYRGRRFAAAEPRRRGVLQSRRRRAGTAVRRRRLAVAARHAARRRAKPSPIRTAKGSVYAEWRKASAVADTRGAGDGRSGRRIGLRGLLQPPRHSDRRVGLRRRGRRLPLAVRQLRVDDEVRRSGLSVSRRGGARRNGDAAQHRERRRAPVRLLGIRARRCAATSRRSSARCPSTGMERADDARLRSAIDRLEREGAAFNAARDSAARGSRADSNAATNEPRADAGRARADSAAGTEDPAVVPQPDLRRRREQRLREHGVAVGERGDSRRTTKRSRDRRSTIWPPASTRAAQAVADARAALGAR